MMRKIVFATAVTFAMLFGAVQLTTETVAGPGDRCQLILCIPCPPGYVLSPHKGNCCRCVPA